MVEGVTQLAHKDGVDWVVEGHRHHLVISDNYDDLAPYLLVECGDWCNCL